MARLHHKCREINIKKSIRANLILLQLEAITTEISIVQALKWRDRQQQLHDDQTNHPNMMAIVAHKFENIQFIKPLLISVMIKSVDTLVTTHTHTHIILTLQLWNLAYDLRLVV